jgi:hypothetical protein
LFGQVTKEQDEQERALRQERLKQERREHWQMMLKGAKDEHERTRFLIDSRLESLYDWLNDFDQRVTREVRAHARATRTWLVCLTVLVAVLFLERLWS